MYGLNNGIPVGLRAVPSFGIARQNQLTAAIQSLFWDGSQGWWYDDDDTSTMYETASLSNLGALSPITAVETSIGLQLDKSKGLARGPELVTNGSFSQGSTGWTAPTNNAVITGGALVFDGVTSIPNDTVITTNTPTASIVAGKIYEVKFDIVSPTTNPITITVGGASFAGSFNAGSYSRLLLSTNTDAPAVRTRLASGVRTGSITNISIKEVLGNHRYAPASGNRPVWSKRVNLLTKTEQFDDAAWTKGAGVSVTNQKTISFTSGGATEFVRQSVTLLSGVAYSVYVRARSVSGNTTLSIDAQNIQNFPGISLTTTFQEFKRTLTMTGARSWIDLQLGGAGVIEIDYIDLRPANQATGTIPLYQRVNTSTDYDTNGFPGYLRADGIDDFLQTNTIGFNTVTSDGQARRNLLDNPTQFDAATWTKNNATVTANATTAPDGTLTADKLIPNSGATNGNFDQSVSVTASTAYTFSFFAKAGEQSAVTLVSNIDGTFRANVFNLSAETATAGTNWTASITAVGNGWYRCIATATASTTTSRPFQISNNSAGWTGDGTSGIFIWGAQLEVGSTATDFQNIGTDKVTLCAGVRKLSDAARAMVTELGADVTQSFQFNAPSAAATTYSFASRGSAAASSAVYNNAAVAAPITNVATGIGDISGDSAILRINGTQVATSSTDQGTGNYGNLPAYFFHRNTSPVTLRFNGYEYSNIAVGKLLTADQLTALETYMNEKTRAY